MIKLMIVTIRRVTVTVMGNKIASQMEVALRYTLLTLLTRFILFSFQNVGGRGKCC